MLGNTSYKLFGYLEHVPIDTGFVTAVFFYNDAYYIQSEGIQREITGFEKVPEMYQHLILAIPDGSIVYKTLWEECIYAFKYCDDVVFMTYQPLVQHLREQLAWRPIADKTRCSIEAFLREENISVEEMEPALVFESEGLINLPPKITGRKTSRSLAEDIDKLLTTPEPAIDTNNSELSDSEKKYLCKPIPPPRQKDIIFSRFYEELYVQQNAIKEYQFKIDIRLLDVKEDLPIVYNWLPWEYTRHLKKETHLEHLREVYTRILSSGTAQPFFILLNNTPIAQMDIYLAIADNISLRYRAQKGDYSINFLIPPKKSVVPNLNHTILTTMLGFLFSFEEVKRVVMCAEKSDTVLNKAFEMANATLLKRIADRHKTLNLYVITNPSQAGE